MYIYIFYNWADSIFKGLNYFHAHRFRSRAVIEFGNPITVSSELVQKFKEGGASKREACSSLLDSIYNALKTVTINAGSYETLMVTITNKYCIPPHLMYSSTL